MSKHRQPIYLSGDIRILGISSQPWIFRINDYSSSQLYSTLPVSFYNIQQRFTQAQQPDSISPWLTEKVIKPT